MKFIFLIIVMLTQFALQMGTIWSVSPSYSQDETSKVRSTEKEEVEIPSKKNKADRKQHEK
ncbi:hypothetical protein [Myroides fluvii]|uniref:hypothetical protein n=1 Tax=Myroides fluvii TaxID=2572594 RepID=UPI001E3B1FCC|nr:hypothetical protein [Myroides fluvii]